MCTVEQTYHFDFDYACLKPPAVFPTHSHPL